MRVAALGVVVVTTSLWASSALGAEPWDALLVLRDTDEVAAINVGRIDSVVMDGERVAALTSSRRIIVRDGVKPPEQWIGANEQIPDAGTKTFQFNVLGPFDGAHVLAIDDDAEVAPPGGLYRLSKGERLPVALQGQPGPSGITHSFGRASWMDLATSANGGLVLREGSPRAVVLFQGGTSAVIVSRNTEIPDRPGRKFRVSGEDLPNPNAFGSRGALATDNGEVAFVDTDDQGNFRALWHWKPSSLSRVLDINSTQESLSLDASTCTIYTTAASTGLAGILFSVKVGGAPTTMLSEGDKLPGYEGRLLRFVSSSMFRAGKLVVLARYDAGDNSSSDQALLLYENGSFQTLLRTEDMIAGAKWDSFAFGTFDGTRIALVARNSDASTAGVLILSPKNAPGLDGGTDSGVSTTPTPPPSPNGPEGGASSNGAAPEGDSGCNCQMRGRPEGSVGALALLAALALLHRKKR